MSERSEALIDALRDALIMEAVFDTEDGVLYAEPVAYDGWNEVARAICEHLGIGWFEIAVILRAAESLEHKGIPQPGLAPIYDAVATLLEAAGVER